MSAALARCGDACDESETATAFALTADGDATNINEPERAANMSNDTHGGLNLASQNQRCAAHAIGVAFLFLSFFGGASARAQSGAVPGFWDPQHRIERPDVSSLRILRLTTEDDYPPFGFTLPDGALAGFNVDLGRAICEELKIPCTLQPRRWDTILPSIEEGRADAAIASIAITPQNRQRVDFTAPYYKTPARFAAGAKSEIADATPESLSGKTIGVEARTSHEAYLRLLFPNAVLQTFESQIALRNALRSGGVGIIFGDGVSLSLWLNGADAAGCCAFVGGAYASPVFFGDGIGIAVRKNNAPLRLALNYALKRLFERGVYADLYLKYFPVGFF